MEKPDGTTDTPTPRQSDHSVRGSFIAVLVMAAFFALTWFGMWALVLERR